MALCKSVLIDCLVVRFILLLVDSCVDVPLRNKSLISRQLVDLQESWFHSTSFYSQYIVVQRLYGAESV